MSSRAGRESLRITQIDHTQSILTRSTGELQSVDGYMNIALEGTREFVDGKMRRSYGDAFVRGNNGALFSFLLETLHWRWLSGLRDERELLGIQGAC